MVVLLEATHNQRLSGTLENMNSNFILSLPHEILWCETVLLLSFDIWPHTHTHKISHLISSQKVNVKG